MRIADPDADPHPRVRMRMLMRMWIINDWQCNTFLVYLEDEDADADADAVRI